MCTQMVLVKSIKTICKLQLLTVVITYKKCQQNSIFGYILKKKTV